MTTKPPTVTRDTCGTYSGWSSHSHRKETPCIECRVARNAYLAQWRKTRGTVLQEYQKQWHEENKEHIQEYHRKHYQENKERIGRQTRQYALAHPEMMRASHKKWVANNPEKDLESKRAWAARNPEYMLLKGRARRALRLGASHEHYAESEVLELWGTDCYLCGEPIDLTAPRRSGTLGWERGLHMEHVIPLSKKGPDTKENVKPSHGPCNLTKGAKILVEENASEDLIKVSP